MSVTISISNTDMDRTLRDLNKYSKEKRKEVGIHVKTTAINIDRLAKQKIISYGVDPSSRLWKSIKYTYNLISATAQVFCDVFFGKYFEFGTKPHIIRAKPGGVLAFNAPESGSLSKRKAYYKNRKTGKLQTKTSKDTTIFAKWVRHPGTIPRPFLGWAVDKERPNYINGIKRILNK